MTAKRIKPVRVAPGRWEYLGFSLVRRIGKVEIIDCRTDDPVLVNRRADIFECRDWIDDHLEKWGENPMSLQERLERYGDRD